MFNVVLLRKLIVENMKRTIKLIHSFILIIFFIFITLTALPQEGLNQTVRGIVVDVDTKTPLVGATIVVEGTTELFMGTTTDVNGNFRLENVQVGRHNFKISYIGYESFTAFEVLVSSGKEVVLKVELKESALALNEIVVRANSNKDKPVNSMATLSARTFSVEETSRYAGGIDDPARLASAFAGVTTTQTTSNAIIIRGNSPRGVLWRFEGVDIPAAFHFPNVDFIGGGGVTVLSNQMLRNSDFYTGAFPAEYGNATSGVFDIRMRTGNSGKREYTAQISMLGADISAEGPFRKGGKATYLFNYRYSTLGLVGRLLSLPNFPTYQDLSFKFDFPVENAGTFSFWALGADDINKKTAERDSAKWENDISRMSQNYFNRFGAIGLSHNISAGEKMFIQSTLSADGMKFGMDKRELTPDLILLPADNVKSTEGKFTFRSVLNFKFGQRVTSRSGITVSSLFFDNLLQKAFRLNPEEMITFVDNAGTGFSTKAFSQFRMDLLPNITANIGAHSMYLNVNRKATLEPRVGLTWRVSQNDELSAGYGLHSQMEELRTYFSQANIDGAITTPNKNLDFMKSHHIVLGYSRKFSDVMRINIEPYYQFLKDIPVLPNSSFAIINITSDWAINQQLENTGTGKNYGIDLTVERFLKDGFYYLLTASLFDSKYTGGDGNEYNTRFNRGYVANALAGKELMVRGKNILGISAKVTYMGGLRYTPALYAESLAARTFIPDHSRAFENQFPSSTGLDFTITYRVNRKKYTGIWSLMVKNALMQPDYSDPFYDYISKDVIIDQMKMPIPSLGYKIEF
jgi:hypothetical protein